MVPIMVEQKPSRERLEQLGVFSWPVMNREVSEFSLIYEEREVCYLLEGEAVVSPEDGAPVELTAGDLVVFPAGLSCRWDVLKPVCKHFRLG
jgi:uncharacterized cupin superfamily protein